MTDKILAMMLTEPLYRGMNQEYLRGEIARCVVAGQYLYKANKIALIYWMVRDNEIDKVCNFCTPDDITTGRIMYVVECVCKDKESMNTIVKELRKIPLDGVFWHRHNKNNRPMIFPRQKGGGI